MGTFCFKNIWLYRQTDNMNWRRIKIPVTNEIIPPDCGAHIVAFCSLICGLNNSLTGKKKPKKKNMILSEQNKKNQLFGVTR